MRILLTGSGAFAEKRLAQAPAYYEAAVVSSERPRKRSSSRLTAFLAHLLDHLLGGFSAEAIPEPAFQDEADL